MTNRPSHPALELALVIALGGCAGDEPNHRTAAEAAANALQLDWIEAPLAVLADDAMGGRENGSAGGAQARQYLVDQLVEHGLTPSGRDGFLQPFAKGVNVLAKLPGSDPALAGEAVLIGAHYDHLGTAGESGAACQGRAGDTICNGAGDNASGVAVLLALARALAAMPTPPRRTLLFAFWDAEEDGLLGSRHFVEQDPIVPLSQIVAAINIDTVGTELFTGLVPLFALGVEYSPELRATVHDNALVAAPSVDTFPVSDFFVGSAQGGRSDHYYFRLADVPVVFFGSGAPVEYHTPADELSIVQRPTLLPIARTILLVAADLANAAARPRFVADPAPHLDDARALVALGDFLVAHPDALGPGGASMVVVIRPLLERARGYLEHPPTTSEGWAEYDAFVRTVIDTVYLLGGR